MQKNFWAGMVPVHLKAPLAALPNPHLTLTASSQRTKQKMEEGTVLGGVARYGSGSGVCQMNQRKLGNQKRRSEGQESFSAVVLAGALLTAFSSFLLVAESAGSRNKDNPEYLLLCQAHSSQRNAEGGCTSAPHLFWYSLLSTTSR